MFRFGSPIENTRSLNRQRNKKNTKEENQQTFKTSTTFFMLWLVTFFFPSLSHFQQTLSRRRENKTAFLCADLRKEKNRFRLA
jgi:cyclopropane fatty-acyl-phospholipid synthase-like methyltransferase